MGGATPLRKETAFKGHYGHLKTHYGTKIRNSAGEMETNQYDGRL